MSHGTLALLAVLTLATLWYGWRWWAIERRRAPSEPRRPTAVDAAIGFGTNFFDTLGIGNFAPTTALFRLLRRVPDEQIPGTLNVGHTVPVLTEALIFIAVVRVDFVTLAGMIAAAGIGAWLGAGVVARLPRRMIQLGMGVALLCASALFVAANLHALPGGGEALGLRGAPLALAIAVNVALGALMTLGIGLYAPCLILVSLLGMSPLAAFPIMMGSCAFLMPLASVRFIEAGRYHLRAALGLALGGIPGVLLAAYVVKSLPLDKLRWLVAVVVLYTAVVMLRAGRRTVSAEQRSEYPSRTDPADRDTAPPPPSRARSP
jgi:uncharacterized membrane protein YfcA